MSRRSFGVAIITTKTGFTKWGSTIQLLVFSHWHRGVLRAEFYVGLSAQTLDMSKFSGASEGFPEELLACTGTRVIGTGLVRMMMFRSYLRDVPFMVEHIRQRRIWDGLFGERERHFKGKGMGGTAGSVC